MKTNTFDVVVVGAGISGLTAAAAAAVDGSARVALVATGPGSFVFGSGALTARGIHLGSDTSELHAAASFFCDTARLAGCPYTDIAGGVSLPTLLGEIHNVTLAPTTICGSVSIDGPTAVVGISGLTSFDENFLAERLNYNSGWTGPQSKYVARQINLGDDFPVPVTLVRIAQRFDSHPHFRAQLSVALRPVAQGFARVLVPGMLGLHSDERQLREFAAEVCCGISEIATLPPTIPSLRVFHRLKSYLQQIGVELYQGFPVSKLEIDNRVCTAMEVDSPGHPMILHGCNVVLATGQHSANLLGVNCSSHDEHMHPLDSRGNMVAENLFVAGSLAHKSAGGDIAGILTGYRAGMLSAPKEVCFANR